MHLVPPTHPPPPSKKEFIIMTSDFAGDDCNTQEMVTVVMQNLGEAWGKQGAVWSM